MVANNHTTPAFCMASAVRQNRRTGDVVKYNQILTTLHRKGVPWCSLRDPDAANAALFNNIIYHREIRTTERSKKHPGATQCHKCQGFGHTKASCKAEPRCATCTGDHATEACDASTSGKSYCVNCTGVHIGKMRKTNPFYSTEDIDPVDLVHLEHSPHAASCPIKRAKAAPNNSRDFFTVTKKNSSTHTVR